MATQTCLGNPAYLATITQLMERKAAIVGYDAPKKTELMAGTGITAASGKVVIMIPDNGLRDVVEPDTEPPKP